VRLWLRMSSNIDEFTIQFEPYKLKVSDYVKGFDPQQFFYESYNLHWF
jgi:hypothetical protein